MKILKIRLVSISILLAMVLTINFSCSLDKSVSLVLDDDSKAILSNAELFGVIHNECLAFIFSDLKETTLQTRSSTQKPGAHALITSANKFLLGVSETTTRANTEVGIDLSVYEQTSIEDIKAQMTERELYYAGIMESSCNRLVNKDDFYDLKIQVINDGELSREQKEAICCFISTAVASCEYWLDNIEEWDILMGYESSQTRASVSTQNPYDPQLSTDGLSIRAQAVLFSDAYWGWTGMLSSGMNPAVGGGAAAVGSGLAYLSNY